MYNNEQYWCKYCDYKKWLLCHKKLFGVWRNEHLFKNKVDKSFSGFFFYRALFSSFVYSTFIYDDIPDPDW